MKTLNRTQIKLCQIVCFSVLLTPLFGYASSDSAKVICSSPQASVNKTNNKPNVIGLISMDEVLPDCSQHVVHAKIQNVGHSESGISLQSVSFKWHDADTTVLTNIGENAALTIDDIRSASQFIQVGKNYLVHFQLCEGVPASLINMYTLDNPVRLSKKSKAKGSSKSLKAV
jgi:hypothetical protein